MFVAKRHLDDSALIRRYLAERGLEALETSDEDGLRHLVRCASCEARYVAMQRAFDDARETVVERADGALSPEQFTEQHARVMRRIDAQVSGPRVLPFPSGAAVAHAAIPSRVIKGWIAAAAVAGLVIGLTAGQLFHFRQDAASSARTAAPAIGPARQTPVLRSVNTLPAADEEAFLSEIDMAASSPHAAELRAIYAFTMEAPREFTPERPKKN